MEKKYISQFSGGLTSFEATRRVIEKYGKENVRIWFADTLSESPDLYRFNEDVSRVFDWDIEIVTVGMDLWEVFEKNKMIGNTRADICSRVLKREPLRKKLRKEYPDFQTAVVVLGMDWTEGDRLKRAISNQLPYECIAPCAEPPIIDKCGIIKYLEKYDIEPPELYKKNFPHNNCNGFCVKAGQTHFYHLLKKMPEVFSYHEKKEAEFREKFGKDVAILRDRRGGQTKPYTLSKLRADADAGKDFYKQHDWGGCGCFVEPAQLSLFKGGPF